MSTQLGYRLMGLYLLLVATLKYFCVFENYHEEKEVTERYMEQRRKKKEEGKEKRRKKEGKSQKKTCKDVLDVRIFSSVKLPCMIL